MITADFFFCNTILDLIMVFFNIWVSQRIFKSKKSNTDKRIAIIHHFWVYLSWGKVEIDHWKYGIIYIYIYIFIYKAVKRYFMLCSIKKPLQNYNDELIPRNVEHFESRIHLFLTYLKFWHFQQNDGHVISLQLIC